MLTSLQDYSSSLVLIALVTGGLIEMAKRLTRRYGRRRWLKDIVLPIAPLVVGSTIAYSTDVHWLTGLAAGLIAGWVYDRTRDLLHDRARDR